jgi:hypothetical protein
MTGNLLLDKFQVKSDYLKEQQEEDNPTRVQHPDPSTR